MPLIVIELLSFGGWRERDGSVTRTYPDQSEQSWGSIYTCLPLDPQSKGSGGHLTQEKQTVEKNIKRKEGEMSKPLLFYHSSQPNILYYHYNNDYSIHILNKKHAGFCSFPKKEKIKILF